METRSTLPSFFRNTVLVGCLVALSACDAGRVNSGNTGRLNERGSSMEAFGSNLVPEYRLASLLDAQAREDGGAIRIVPLVFDANGDLYTPASYHDLIERIMSDPAGPEQGSVQHPPVYYTDYETFQQILAQGVTSGDGRSYQEI